jgi:hypothetical protein
MRFIQAFLIFLALLHGSTQINFNRIDTWAEGISVFAKNYKFMSLAELFLCESMTSNGAHRLARRLNERDIYCNVNLIDTTQFDHIDRMLASINYQRHTIMIVDLECAFAWTLVKIVSINENSL